MKLMLVLSSNIEWLCLWLMKGKAGLPGVEKDMMPGLCMNYDLPLAPDAALVTISPTSSSVGPM